MGKLFHVAVKLPVELEELPAQAQLDRGLPFRFPSADGTYFLSTSELSRVRSKGVSCSVLRILESDTIPVRFILPHEGGVCDVPPEDARLAVLSRLLAEGRASGEVHVRFLGRDCAVPPDGFALDRFGGHRCYVWQPIPAEAAEPRGMLRERFSALRALFAAPETRVVLALGSGGVKLFAHAPVLRLLEHLGCAEDIDEIWGTSGGAVVGLLYSHGLSPQAIEQAGYDLYTGRYDLSIRPSTFQVLRHLVRDTLTAAGSAGFVDLTGGLSRMLDHYCATLIPRRPFYCVAFNAGDCRPEVLTPVEVPEHLKDFAVETDARAAALASSAVPLLSLPHVIDRSGRPVPYVDGSTTEDVPIYSAARKWDLDRCAGVEERERLVILSVKLTGPVTQYRSPGGQLGKLRLLQTVASAGMQAVHERDVAALSIRPDVDLLRLQLADEGDDFFEVRRIPVFIRAAKECFPLQLAEIERSLRER